MMNPSKYKPGYFVPPCACNDWVSRTHIDKAPVWCSVDMRDGNQSLVIPMSLDEKLDYFTMLVQTGFKEIEVGFPAASETEYEFLRTIIENKMIPDDVTVQVLTQCREHIIRKTFEACRGASNAIIHFYNSISKTQREQVFKKSRKEIMDIAVKGAKLVKKLSAEYDGNFRFEYSPESFTATEPEYALEVCNAVLDVLQPGPNNNVIINLPVTVEMSLPHIYASQVEYMSKNLKYRPFVTLSLHPHNDRGTGVADTELALLAGAERVEGTLFGNGERTGNVDIVTLALNMYSHGIDPMLNLENLPDIVKKYEKCTRMHVHERSPYAGALVFAAFSGSHQDAIAKSMKYHAEKKLKSWSVPYIPIDPRDISRTYDADVIRVNSQSGKGGIAYVLENATGYVLPQPMREHFSYLCKNISDHEHRELKSDDIIHIFNQNYLVEKPDGVSVKGIKFTRSGEHILANVTFAKNGEITTVSIAGNGSLDAVSNALKEYSGKKYLLWEYTEHSLRTSGSKSSAVAYIGIKAPDDSVSWGIGIDTDIIHASVDALINAFNNMESHCIKP